MRLAARYSAAWRGARYAAAEDVEEAAQFVLPHRMRKPPEQQPEEQEQQDDNQNEEENEQDNEDNPDDENNDEDNEDNQLPPPPPLDNGDDDEDDDASDDEDEDEESDEDEQQQERNDNNLAPEEQLADIDKSFRLPKMLLDLGKEQCDAVCGETASVPTSHLKPGTLCACRTAQEQGNRPGI